MLTERGIEDLLDTQHMVTNESFVVWQKEVWGSTDNVEFLDAPGLAYCSKMHFSLCFNFMCNFLPIAWIIVFPFPYFLDVSLLLKT